MSANYFPVNTTPTDHDLTLAIPGDVESVRLRLTQALESLGYKVLTEQPPIQARRSGQGCARWDCSLNVLDYPTSLTISLKQTNDVAVVAIFNYEIKSYIRMTTGDRQTLMREAEALAALTTERLAISACSACGTQVNDESNFCRRCGAPLVINVPELEVLRLTRGTRAAYHNIFVGMVALLLAALTVLPLFVVNGARIYGPLVGVGIPLVCYGLFLLLPGIWQIHQTLNPKSLKPATAKSPPLLSSPATIPLSAATGNASITEGTTELLTPTPELSVKQPTRRKEVDTSEIRERVM